MEKYYVIESDDQHGIGYCQHLKIKNKAGRVQDLLPPHSIPKIPVGTLVKIYETANQEPFPLTMAYSYRINGRRFVNISRAPYTKHGIEEFWSELNFFDCLQLHRDIKQALRNRDIVPAFNKNSNLQLLLGIQGNSLIR